MLLCTVLLLKTLVARKKGGGTPRWGSESRSERARERGYSAATATTTTRDAAQIDCAALGEHGLEAG